MALTGRVIFSAYPYNGKGDPTSATIGRMQSLPSALTNFYAAPPGTTAGNNITINSIVELLPTGLNQPSKKFYTPSTTTELQDNGN